MESFKEQMDNFYHDIDECNAEMHKALEANDFDKLEELSERERELTDGLKKLYVSLVDELLIFSNMKGLSGDDAGNLELKKKCYEFVSRQSLYSYFDDEKLKEIGFTDEEIAQARKLYPIPQKPKKI